MRRRLLIALLGLALLAAAAPAPDAASGDDPYDDLGIQGGGPWVD